SWEYQKKLAEPNVLSILEAAMSTSPFSRTLNGQVAVVTGGGRGIGAAIARRLAGLGMATVICGRSPSPLDQTAAGIVADGGKCEAVACDITRFDDVEALASRVRSTFSRVDVLVNNAGVGSFSGPLHELPAESWEEVLNT